MIRPAVALLAVMLLTACGGGAGSSGEVTSAPAATGEPAASGAALEGDTVAGDRLSLAEFRGKPVFVNVWASW